MPLLIVIGLCAFSVDPLLALRFRRCWRGLSNRQTGKSKRHSFKLGFTLWKR